jgi:hypothetical protein
MITKEDLYKALIAVKNEATGEQVYSEEEARNLIEKMDEDYISYVNSAYKDAEEWADYYCM